MLSSVGKVPLMDTIGVIMKLSLFKGADAKSMTFCFANISTLFLVAYCKLTNMRHITI